MSGTVGKLLRNWLFWVFAVAMVVVAVSVYPPWRESLVPTAMQIYAWGEGVSLMISSNPYYVQYFAPFPLPLLWGCALFVPLGILIHSRYIKMRAGMVKQAQRDAGLQFAPPFATQGSAGIQPPEREAPK